MLDIVSALRRILIDGVRITHEDAFPTSTLTRLQAHDLQVFKYRALLDETVFDYRLEVGHDPSSQRARILLGRLTGAGGPLFECRLGEVQLYRDDHPEGPKFKVDWSESTLGRVAAGDDDRLLTRFLEFVRGILVCGLEPTRFATWHSPRFSRGLWSCRICPCPRWSCARTTRN